MDTNLEQQLTKRMEELPKDVHDAILSADLDKRIQEIGAAHMLHLDQIGNLNDEIMLVMLGFTDTKDFTANITKQLNLAPADAQTITTEVNDKLFLPIRDSMKRFMEARNTTNPAAKSSVPPPISTIKPPQPPPALPIAEKLLSEKTVVTPSAAPSAPQGGYKTDPYREPIE